MGADVPLGYYDVRLVGKFGVTNSRTFTVGELPEVVEQEPNNVQAKAMRVALGTVINGRSLPTEDVDQFVFSAKAGERVLIDCRAARVDSAWTAFCGCSIPAAGNWPATRTTPAAARSSIR